MNVIRKLNIFLLIVALILMFIFIPKACKENNSDNGGGNSPSHTHYYYSYRSSSQHWEECSCGSIRNSGFHSYTNGKCKYCGYQDYSHTHSYDTIKYDEYECWTECSCGAKTNVDYHYYVDGKCLYCDYNDPSHTHSYTTLKSNDTEHWYECFCGEKNNVSSHNGSATCTKKAFCTTCNKEYGGYANHTDASTYSYNDSKHWLVATCGCDLKKSEGSHVVVGNSTSCSVCGYPVKATEGVTYDLSSDGTYAEVIGYSGESGIVRIASTYQNLPVKSIYSEAFKNSSITAVIIPDSVTSIGSRAFYGCNYLKSVTMGSGVKSIGDCAFGYCGSLTSVTIPDSAINSCNFHYNMFQGCSNLYTEKDYVRYIKINNNDYYLAQEVTNKNLSSYTIQSGTIFLGGVFNQCSRLVSAVIPESVITMGNGAFGYCSSLTSIKYRGSASQWSEIKKGSNWAIGAGSYTVTYNYTGD